MKSYVEFPIIMNVITNQVKGDWIIQECYKFGCNKKVMYWSKTGEKLIKYDRAMCEVHRNA